MHIVLLALLLGCVGGEGGDRGSGSSQASLPTGLTVLDVWEVTPDALRSPQHHPALDLDQSDTLAVTWDEETNPPGAYLRLFDSSGMALTEFQRFTMCPEDVPCRPDIVAAGGRFWLGWADDEGVKLARFDASLEREGDTVLLEATPEGERLEAPDLAVLPDGSVVATWFGSDRLEGGETARYRLVRVTSDGVVQPRTELDVGLAGGSPPDVTSTDLGAAVVWVARESGDDGVSTPTTSSSASTVASTLVATSSPPPPPSPRAPLPPRSSRAPRRRHWRASRAARRGARHRQVARGREGDTPIAAMADGDDGIGIRTNAKEAGKNKRFIHSIFETRELHLIT